MINEAIDTALKAIMRHFEQSTKDALFIVPLNFDAVAIQARLIAHSHNAGLTGNSVTFEGRCLNLRYESYDLQKQFYSIHCLHLLDNSYYKTLVHELIYQAGAAFTYKITALEMVETTKKD